MGQAESISLLFSTHGSSPDILVVVKIYEGGGTPFGAPSWLFSGGGYPLGAGLVVVVFFGVGVLEGSDRSDIMGASVSTSVRFLVKRNFLILSYRLQTSCMPRWLGYTA